MASVYSSSFAEAFAEAHPVVVLLVSYFATVVFCILLPFAAWLCYRWLFRPDMPVFPWSSKEETQEGPVKQVHTGWKVRAAEDKEETPLSEGLISNVGVVPSSAVPEALPDGASSKEVHTGWKVRASLKKEETAPESEGSVVPSSAVPGALSDDPKFALSGASTTALSNDDKSYELEVRVDAGQSEPPVPLPPSLPPPTLPIDNEEMRVEDVADSFAAGPRLDTSKQVVLQPDQQVRTSSIRLGSITKSAPVGFKRASLTKSGTIVAEFAITLNKSQDSRLGVVVDHWDLECCETLLVERVVDGLVATWNVK